VVVGVRGPGSTPSEFENNRAFATSDFTHLNEDITYTQHLPFDTLGIFHFGGQLADEPLLSSEQFAAGGLTSVRGYLQSEAIGDDGILESSEIRSPSLTKFVSPYLDMSAIDDWRVYGFADLAHVWVLGALPSQTDNFTLESVGAGMRIGALGHLTGLIDVGLPLRSGPATPARKPRLTFSVKSEM
jgi:hemolysin activation/secretion protein